jgi:hypothetical protein
MKVELLKREMKRMDHFVLPPNAGFQHLSGVVGDEMKIHFFAQWDVGNRDVLVEERNPAIAIHDAGVT